MKTFALLLVLTAFILTACDSPRYSTRPDIPSGTRDIGAPSNWHGNSVTSPSM